MTNVFEETRNAQFDREEYGKSDYGIRGGEFAFAAAGCRTPSEKSKAARWAVQWRSRFMQAIVKETNTRRRDYFPLVSVLRFGHSGNTDYSGVRVSSGNNFCYLFRQEMEGLYLLAFLLTANPETAEQCFISSLEECMGGVAVDEEWAHSWAKRVVIKNAIRLVAPHVHRSSSKVLPGFRQKECEPSELSSDNRTLISLLALGAFERFVFVMTVLEQLSDRDSALLLGRIPDKIRAARMRALQEVAFGNAARSRHTSSQKLPKQARIATVY